MRDVVFAIHALGTLEPEEMVQVTAQVGGVVSDVRFHEGDSVTPSTVLARIDPERYRLEAERADAAYRKAVASEERSRADTARRESLAKAELVSEEDLARARQETSGRSADTAAAGAERAIALQNVARAEVHAPRAGIINT